MSTLSNVMGAGAFLPPMIHALHSFHGVWQRIGTFGRDFKDIRDSLRIEECRFGEVLNCDLQSLAKIGDTAQTVQAVNRQVANIQSHLDSCHGLIDWYNDGAAGKDAEQQASGPEALQSAAGFPRRARWAIIDWQKLHNSLEHIRTAANSALFPVQKALSRLHHGLAGLNGASQPDHQLSIQLREHWDSTSAELSTLAEVEVRDGSYVFNIQKAEADDPETDSILLLIDTPKKVPGSQDEDSITKNLSPMMSLHGPKEEATSSSSGQRSQIETWGYFSTPPRRSLPNDIHIVHRATTSWRSPLCLTDILYDPSYVEHITPIEITWLAKLLVTSHLCFLPVQRELNIQPRPSNYRFYCKPEDDFDPWVDGSPLVLEPFLSIGFGTSRKSTFGALSEFNHPPYASVMELGLVLYQVGAGRVINYGAGRAGLAQAEAKILRELEQDSSVDAFAGSSYVSIIEGCLNMWTRFRQHSDDLAAMQRREEEYLLEVVAQMSDDLQLLEDIGPDTDAANLDSRGITETISENEILLQLKALTQNHSDQPPTRSILKWSRIQNGQNISVLECPFSRLSCHTHYSSLAAWFWHTLTHFQLDEQCFPRKILPPATNTCCICEKRFIAVRGIESWQQLLAHNAYHHLHGHSITEDATALDTELYTYMWHHGLIDEVTYKEIKGTPAQDSGFNPVDKIVSPVVSALSSAPMLGEEAMPATVLAERRLDRGGRWLS